MECDCLTTFFLVNSYPQHLFAKKSFMYFACFHMSEVSFCELTTEIRKVDLFAASFILSV